MHQVLFNTHDLALLITIYECLLFAFCCICLKKGKKQSNILLALFLLSYAAIPLDTLISFGEAFRSFAIDLSPNLFYVFGNAYWLEAVFLLFYVRSLVYKDFRLRWRDGLYFLPFCFYLVHEYANWFAIDYDTKIALLKGYKLAEEPTHIFYVNLFRECFRAFCGTLCLIELWRYQKQIKNQLADIEAVDLTWLKVLVLGFLLVRIDAIIVTVGFILTLRFDINIDYELLGLASNWAVLFLISFLIFFSLGFSTAFPGIEPRGKQQPEQAKAPIDMAEVDRITSYMQDTKPFLNHLLNIDNLSTQLNMSPRALSQIINRHFNQNFFEFINQYRIDESKRLLLLPENKTVTMLEIMDQSGFNSKATFNTFFKKLVGKTPSQFRKDEV